MEKTHGASSIFSPSHHSLDDVKLKSLNNKQKAGTLILTFFATLLTLPLLGIGGLATYRACKRAWSKSDFPQDQKTTVVAQKTLNQESIKPPNESDSSPLILQVSQKQESVSSQQQEMRKEGQKVPSPNPIKPSNESDSSPLIAVNTRGIQYTLVTELGKAPTSLNEFIKVLKTKRFIMSENAINSVKHIQKHPNTISVEDFKQFVEDFKDKEDGNRNNILHLLAKEIDENFFNKLIDHIDEKTIMQMKQGTNGENKTPGDYVKSLHSEKVRELLKKPDL